jgi:predicted deacetylase
MSKQLIVSVHDVTPYHRERLERLESLLATWGLGNRYSMLVVPNFWRHWPLEAHPDFCAWLRGRAEAGVEMVLHGFYHRDETSHKSALARWTATTMTAREGEFLGLQRAEALRRIAAGKGLVENIVGRPVTTFVAPAWLYSSDTHAALRELGFQAAEDQFSVWSPAAQRVLSRAPVVSYASRTPARMRSSLVWSRLAKVLLTPCRTVRLALHPHDLDRSALVTEIECILKTFRRRDPISYTDLVARESASMRV